MNKKIYKERNLCFRKGKFQVENRLFWKIEACVVIHNRIKPLFQIDNITLEDTKTKNRALPFYLAYVLWPNMNTQKTFQGKFKNTIKSIFEIKTTK